MKPETSLNEKGVKDMVQTHARLMLGSEAKYPYVMKSTSQEMTILYTVERSVWQLHAELSVGAFKETDMRSPMEYGYDFRCLESVPIEYLRWVMGEVQREEREAPREAPTPAVEEVPELRSGDSYAVPAKLLR